MMLAALLILLGVLGMFPWQGFAREDLTVEVGNALRESFGQASYETLPPDIQHLSHQLAARLHLIQGGLK